MPADPSPLTRDLGQPSGAGGGGGSGATQGSGAGAAALPATAAIRTSSRASRAMPVSYNDRSCASLPRCDLRLALKRPLRAAIAVAMPLCMPLCKQPG